MPAGSSHDSLDDLGYDWSRIADPHIAAQPPFKVYLPRSTADVARAVQEMHALGQDFRIRGGGHSANDLVLAAGGNVLHLRAMDRIHDLDPHGETVTVGAGATLVEVDRQLARHGFGLPVIGDNPNITAGGFASVGGVGPASHRYGLFVDNVAAVEYVAPDGSVARCGRDRDPAMFRKLLTGCGRHGVITQLTLDLLAVDKREVWLVNEPKRFRDVEAFVAGGVDVMNNPESARMQRGFWCDVRAGVTFGQWSNYRVAEPTAPRRLQRNLSIGARSLWGASTAHIPRAARRVARMASAAAIVFPPHTQTMADAETMADLVMNYRALDNPTRWYAAWPALDNYATAFERIYQLFREYRSRTGCFTVIAVLTQAIRSPYLGPDPIGAVMMICTVDPAAFTAAVQRDLVADLDRICIEERAMRYMHSATSHDPDLLALLDPNRILNAEELARP